MQLFHHLELAVFPPHSKHRAWVRRMLRKPGAMGERVASRKFEQSFDDFCTSRAQQKSVLIVSSTRFLENEGQSAVHYAREFAQRGYAVFYIYWRWDGHPISTQDYLAENIFLLPLDYSPAFKRIFSSFCAKESILLSGMPSPLSRSLLESANEAGWNTAYLALDDWTGFSKIKAADWFSVESEEFIVANSGTNIAINDYLAQQLKEKGAPTVHLVPNGLKTGIELVRENIELTRGKVTLGFFGYLAPGWFDWDLVAELAKNNPDWLIYIIGYPSALPWGLPANIKFLGKIRQDLLASYAHHWDVGIVPFKVGAIADGADPIKTYEYLAMGLPVVVSGVNPPIGGEKFVKRADEINEFENAVLQALRGNFVDTTSRREFAFTCSWSQRCEMILQAVRQKSAHISGDNVFTGPQAPLI
jgi:glycosyltransferase involved in cell wall biosynthesis